MQSHTTERSDQLAEGQLEILLQAVLDDDASQSLHAATAAPPEIVQLRDAARRLRASSQRFPLPEGRLAVRRALLVTTEQSRSFSGAGRASWRRAGLWLSMAAMALVAGAFGLGAGALDALVHPSSPLYGFRIVLDKARGVFVPGLPGVGQYALAYRFSALQVNPKNALVRTAEGKVGGLPVTLTLTTAGGGCTAGETCGTFVVSLAGLSDAASTQFGEMRGTFGCEPNGCTLALVEMTGVFAKVIGPNLSVSTAGMGEGQLGSKVGSLGEWVKTVASAAEKLQANGMLPAELSIADLVRDAATNGQKRNSRGPSGSSSGPNIVSTTVDGLPRASITGNTSGVPGVSGGARVQVSTGVDRSPTSHSNRGSRTVQNNASIKAGAASHSVASGRSIADANTGVVVGTPQGGRGGLNRHGGNVLDPDSEVTNAAAAANGGALTGGGAGLVGGGAGVSDSATVDSAGAVTGGATITGGVSTGTGAPSVSGGVSATGGVSTGTGAPSVSGGVSATGGVSTGSGGANASGGASAGAGASTGSGGTSVSGGASVGGVSVGAGTGIGGGGGVGGGGLGGGGAAASNGGR